MTEKALIRLIKSLFPGSKIFIKSNIYGLPVPKEDEGILQEREKRMR